MRATACTFCAIEPGNRCTAGGSEHSEANCSGSAAAISAGSRLPKRSRIFAGPPNACAIGYCWSRSMPSSSANGDPSRTSSAFSSPVMWMAIRTSCQPCGATGRRGPSWGRVGDMQAELAEAITHELRVFVAAASPRRSLPSTVHVGQPAGEHVVLPEVDDQGLRTDLVVRAIDGLVATEGACAWVTRGGEIGTTDLDAAWFAATRAGFA